MKSQTRNCRFTQDTWDMRVMGVAFAALLCTSGIRAQGFEPDHLLDRVYFDRSTNGGLWALGNSWKMSFTSDGATFVPFLGADAPRNYPIAFRLESVTVGGESIAFDPAASPATNGDRVNFRRGSFVESYRLDPDHVEQLFLFEECPGTGELIVRITTETDLECKERSDALHFSNDRGEVTYTKAIAFDVNGAKLALETKSIGGGIEIRVPAEFVAAAEFPLTIDPLVTTFGISGVGGVDRSDVAWDEATEQYMVVYERSFSSSDTDLFSQFRTRDGAWVVNSNSAVDLTGVNRRNPSVANLRAAADFLVVYEDGQDGSRFISGRIRSATTGLFQGPFVVADGIGEEIHGRVGGDPYPTLPSHFCVVWERVGNTADHDILARLVDPDSTLFGPEVQLDGSFDTDDQRPAISKSNDESQWTIAWQTRFGPSDRDIRAARVSWTGLVSESVFPVDSSSLNHRNPSVSSMTPAGDYVIAYEEATNSSVDLVARRMQGSVSQDWMYVTDLDGSPPGTIHYPPTAVCDGTRFFVVYNEHPFGNIFSRRAFVSTLGQTSVGFLTVVEGHVPLGGLTSQEFRTAAATSGSSSGELLATWAGRNGSGTFDLYGAIYDIGAPANDSCVNATPIAGTGAFPFDNVGASDDGPPISACVGTPLFHSDVWYEWTPPSSGLFSVTTCGGTTLDTTVAVYGGAGCPSAEPIGCNDDTCSTQSQVTFDAVHPQPYLIRVASWSEVEQGSGEFTIERVSSGGTLGVGYCVSAPNTFSSAGSTISASGSTSATANDLVLVAEDMPPGTPALFYFGAVAIQTSFGEGVRCVGAPTWRLLTVFADAVGTGSLAIDNGAFSGTLLLPGFTRYFQCWYRDPAGGPSGFNLSNGLQLTFVF